MKVYILMEYDYDSAVNHGVLATQGEAEAFCAAFPSVEWEEWDVEDVSGIPDDPELKPYGVFCNGLGDFRVKRVSSPIDAKHMAWARDEDDALRQKWRTVLEDQIIDCPLRDQIIAKMSVKYQ